MASPFASSLLPRVTSSFLSFNSTFLKVSRTLPGYLSKNYQNPFHIFLAQFSLWNGWAHGVVSICNEWKFLRTIILVSYLHWTFYRLANVDQPLEPNSFVVGDLALHIWFFESVLDMNLTDSSTVHWPHNGKVADELVGQQLASNDKFCYCWLLLLSSR